MTGVPPIIGDVSRPWWDALARHEISMQRCEACQSFVFYPRIHCPSCGGRDLRWTKVDGRASLYSWTIAEAPIAPAFRHLDRPVIAIAELDNGVRLPTRIVETDPADLSIGMALEPVFDEDKAAGVTLLHFRKSTD